MLLAVTTAKLAGARTLIGASWSDARELEDARVTQLQLAPHYYSRASSTQANLTEDFPILIDQSASSTQHENTGTPRMIVVWSSDKMYVAVLQFSINWVKPVFVDGGMKAFFKNNTMVPFQLL